MPGTTLNSGHILSHWILTSDLIIIWVQKCFKRTKKGQSTKRYGQGRQKRALCTSFKKVTTKPLPSWPKRSNLTSNANTFNTFWAFERGRVAGEGGRLLHCEPQRWPWRARGMTSRPPAAHIPGITGVCELQWRSRTPPPQQALQHAHRRLFTRGTTSTLSSPWLRGWQWLRRLLDVLGMFCLWRHEREQLNNVNYWPIWKTSCPWAVHLQTTPDDLDLTLLNKTPWGCGRERHGSGTRPSEGQALLPSFCVPLDKRPHYLA